MKSLKREWVRTAALSAAAIMVVAGLVLCRVGTPVASSTVRGADTSAEAQEQAPQVAPAESAPETDPPDLQSEETAPPEQALAESQPPAPEPRKQTRPAAPKPRTAARKPVPQAYLPPFQPGLYGASDDGPTGPPPNVLWLSGVIQGEPKVAVLRRGGNRYYVREGDLVEGGYRVARISSDRVTLRRGGRTQVLRLGQY